MGEEKSRTVTDYRDPDGKDTAKEWTEDNEWDAFGRPKVVHYLDGTTVQATYAGCCGIETLTDASGVTTHFDYDGLKRLLWSKRNGVYTFFEYNAESRIRKISRGPTLAPEDLVPFKQYEYDTAGRLAWEREKYLGDGLFERNTRHEELFENGRRVLKITHPDAAQTVVTFNRDNMIERITGPAVKPGRYSYGLDVGSGYFRKETKLGKNAFGEYEDLQESKSTFLDKLGRVKKTVFSGQNAAALPYAEAFYNSKGQIWKSRDRFGVVRLLEYNLQGDLSAAGIDMDGDDVLSSGQPGPDGDRKSIISTTIVTQGADVLKQTDLKTWNDNGTEVLVKTVESAVNRQFVRTTVFKDGTPPVQTSVAVSLPFGDPPTQIRTTTHPDSSTETETFENGRLVCYEKKDGSTSPQLIAKIQYEYESGKYGRLWKIKTLQPDGTFTTKTLTYYEDDRIKEETIEGAGVATQTTQYAYDLRGRLATTTLSDASQVHRAYNGLGLLEHIYGSRVYDVTYGYDDHGRMTSLYYNQGPGADYATTWQYHPQFGTLMTKKYQNVVAAAYTFNDKGQLYSRTDGRGLGTVYAHNQAGELSLIDYGSAEMKDVEFHYDRRGRAWKIMHGPLPVLRNWLDNGLLESESGYGFKVKTAYDALLRRDNVKLFLITDESTPLTQTGYGYDDASRLNQVKTENNVQRRVEYDYHPNSSLVHYRKGWRDGNNALTATTTFDHFGRLKEHQTISGVLGYEYTYNNANQRTFATLEDGSYWEYLYDSFGHLRLGKKSWPDGQVFFGQHFDYSFDNRGNRLSSVRGGQVLQTQPNWLNQFESQTASDKVHILGEADGDTVKVNLETLGPLERRGAYFDKELTVDNSSPLWQKVDVVAIKNTGPDTEEYSTASGYVFVPDESVTFAYDAAGNLTDDGRWHYLWDAENRLIEMETTASAVAGGVPKHKLAFEYDWAGRRIFKKFFHEWDAATGLYQNQTSTTFVYDGWNLVAELDHNNQPRRTYYWGQDLSGTLQGAGGVGGLVAMQTWEGASPTLYFYCYDGNGNVVGLLDAQGSQLSAQYEYGPFGEPIRATGPMAKANPFRFSTKYTDEETGLVYYGYRYYSPTLGRWLSRDPIGEEGGVNVYGFVGNNPLSFFDYLGLEFKTEIDASGNTKLVWIDEGGCKSVFEGMDDVMVKMPTTLEVAPCPPEPVTPPVPGKVQQVVWWTEEAVDAVWNVSVAVLFTPEHGSSEIAINEFGDPLLRLGCYWPSKNKQTSSQLIADLTPEFQNVLYARSGRAKCGPQARTSRNRSRAANTAAAEARGGTYVLREVVTEQVMRTGRTCDLVRREGEHARDVRLRDFKFEAVHRTDVYSQQRGLEQLLHQKYNPPLDKINAVSPSNPNRQSYSDAAQQFLQGGNP